MLFLSVESPVVGDVRFVFIWLYRGVRGKCIWDLISSEIPNLLNNMRPVVVYYEFTGESGAVHHNKTRPKGQSPTLSPLGQPCKVQTLVSKSLSRARPVVPLISVQCAGPSVIPTCLPVMVSVQVQPVPLGTTWAMRAAVSVHSSRRTGDFTHLGRGPLGCALGKTTRWG